MILKIRKRIKKWFKEQRERMDDDDYVPFGRVYYFATGRIT